MLIAEELMLVTRADSGDDHVGYAEIAVAGAMLCELALRERLTVQNTRLVVVDRTPTGDDLLDRALERFAEREGKKPKDVLSRVGERVAKEVLHRLSRAEVMQERSTRALGMRLFPAWEVVDTDRRDALREEPAHPTHAASRPRITDSMAVTRPPGLRRHSSCPSSPVTRSTGSRLAAMTNEYVSSLMTRAQLLGGRKTAFSS